MSKKNHKRKSSKALTKNQKVLQDPTAHNLNQQMNQNTQFNNKFKKKS